MRTLALAFIASLVLGCSDIKQAPQQSSLQVDPGPRPRTGPLAAKPGTFGVRGYETVGRVGRIRVEAHGTPGLLLDTMDGLLIRVAVANGDSVDVFLQLARVTKTIPAIDSLFGMRTNPSRLLGFEMQYVASPDFRLAVQSDVPGERQYLLFVGNVDPTTVRLSAEEMRRFRAILNDGVELLVRASIP